MSVWIIEARTYRGGKHRWSPMFGGVVFRTREHARSRCKELTAKNVHCGKEFGVCQVKYRPAKYEKVLPLATCGYYPPADN